MSNFTISPSPHVHGGDSIEKNMYGVLIALVPTFIFSIVFFGLGAILVTLTSVAACLVFEYVIQKYLMKQRPTIWDGSAIITGVLLAFNLPSSLPLWIVVIGALVAIGIGNIPSFARVVRGEVHIVKNEEYCNACRVIGVSNTRLLFTHILPNAISPIIVYATLNVASAIISEAALSFLGLGIAAPTASWGSILREGKSSLTTAPFVATISGAFILITVLGFNLFGDGIRDVLDPKMKQ